MRIGLAGIAVGGAFLCVGGPAAAHHSFAVFFDQDKTAVVTGVVTEFQFANPHGLIALVTKDGRGAEQSWRVETNSPSILQRRGWTRNSIKVGDRVTVEGWPARDGSNYMRMRKVSDGDGKVIGQPLDAPATN